MIGAYCDGCGRPGADCREAAATGESHGCRSRLDPPRYCGRCGRRLTVQVFPTHVEARCRQHGPVEVEVEPG